MKFLFLVVKIILFASALTLSQSLSLSSKTPCFVNLSFSSTLQLINSISNDSQKLLRYFTGTAIALFFRIPFA